ncbi:MAG: hypothetical protein L3J22_04410 [Xanthomonadales bacterium]|nr:hypothetical protein [Xanthomonadales bacterium]
MSNETMNKVQTLSDPCQLRSLPAYDAPDDLWDLWPSIQARQEEANTSKTVRRPFQLALAASVLLALFLINQLYMQNPAELTAPGKTESLNPIAGMHTSENDTKYIPPDSILGENQSQRLIAMSQKLEDEIASDKNQNSPVLAANAIIIAELEDMIAVIDEQLASQNTDTELWYRRVTLLADLSAVYAQNRNLYYRQYVGL